MVQFSWQALEGQLEENKYEVYKSKNTILLTKKALKWKQKLLSPSYLADHGGIQKIYWTYFIYYKDLIY